MKKIFLINLLSVLLILNIFAQSDEYTKAVNYLSTKGEVYFTFTIADKKDIKEITKIISIDNIDGLKVFAYANKNQFESFISVFNYPYQVLTHPGDLLPNIKMYDLSQKISYDYLTYPTYDAYLEIMKQFQTKYPGLCKIVEIGTSVNNRKLLFAKISDNVNASENEGQFMYTSSMHGDETTGYILMLRLIDFLLSNYGTNAEVTNLVNNLEIWINPLANPDGTYAGGNNSVAGARRGNANYVDLNRNFPDPEDGDHPDGNTWQPETQAFMTLANQNNFIMSANFHGGTEVVNYPWDTWEQRHPEDAWFQKICHLYADLAQENSTTGYMDGFNDGITNGYDWYEVNGGRQDYMNYYYNCREVTIELSNTKLLPESQLNNLWNYNYRSLLAYMAEAPKLIDCKSDLILTESISGGNIIFLASNSITASNTISGGATVNYGANNSVKMTSGFKVYTGNSFRANLAGCNAVSANSSVTKVLALSDKTVKQTDMVPFKIYPNPNNGVFTIENDIQITSIEIMDMYGKLILKKKLNCSTCPLHFKLPAGIYILNVINKNKTISEKLIIR